VREIKIILTPAENSFVWKEAFEVLEKKINVISIEGVKKNV
jgi:hypothetical protein